jgi:hypothetical protein
MAISFLRSLFALTVIIVALCVPIRVSAFDGPCDGILKQGIMNKYKYVSEDKLNVDLKLLLNMSRAELQKYADDNSGSIAIPIYGAMIGAAFSSKSDSLKELREHLKVDQKLNYSSSASTIIELELVDEGIVKAWRDCVAQHAHQRLATSIRGSTEKPDGEFIISLDYVPTSDFDPPTYTIKAITITGAEPVGESRLKPDAIIKRFSGVSKLYKRKGTSKVDVTIDFDGNPSITSSIDEITVPKPAMVRTVTIPAEGQPAIVTPSYIPPLTNGDSEFDSNNDNFAQFELRAWLEKQNNDTQLYVRVSMKGRETEPDNTTVEGTSPADARFLVYQAPPGEKIIEIVKPTVTEDVLVFRDYGKNDQNEWSHQVRHYSAASFKAKLEEISKRPSILNLSMLIAENYRKTTTITSNNLVGDWEVLGDTDGDEAGSRTYVKVTLLPITLKVKKIAE